MQKQQVHSAGRCSVYSAASKLSRDPGDGLANRVSFITQCPGQTHSRPGFLALRSRPHRRALNGSFGRDDLAMVIKVADQAHKWILVQSGSDT